MFRNFSILVVAILVATVIAAAEVETVSRVFRLRHISLTEASAVVQPMLSEVGSVTLQPGLSRMTVQDVPAVISRVAAMIDQLDHVPGMYRVKVELLEGGDKEPFGAPYQVDPDDRLRRMFKAEEYRRLGNSVIEGELGSTGQADLGTSFRVSFVATIPEFSRSSPWGSPDPGDRIHLRGFILERITTTGDGTQTAEELLRTNVLLSPRQTVYIGAGNSEDTEDVLVLIVHAEDFGSR